LSKKLCVVDYLWFLVSSWTPPIVNTQATSCKPSSGAIPKTRSTQKQFNKADDHKQTHTGSENQVVVTEDFSLSQLPVSGLDSTIGESDQEKLEKNCQSFNSECPPQSLSLTDENAIKDVAKVNVMNDHYAEIDVVNAFNRVLFNVKSQQSNCCPSRPNRVEEVCSKQEPLPFVTGHRSFVNSSTAVVSHLEESGCPAENDEVKLKIL